MSKVIRLKTEIFLEEIKFPESPRWHDNKLWFSDMDSQKVMTADLDGNTEIIIDLPNSPSGLGWLLNDKLLIVSMEDRRLLRLEPEGLIEVANLQKLATYHCNDMVVDKQGQAYIGDFGFDWKNKAPFVPAEIILVNLEGKA